MSDSLNKISPIDGRYYKVTQDLTNYFSEAALIKYRIYVEIEYFIGLSNLGVSELKKISKQDLNKIKEIYSKINHTDIKRIKEIEHVTNHDVKAVEYFIKEKF